MKGFTYIFFPIDKFFMLVNGSKKNYTPLGCYITDENQVNNKSSIEPPIVYIDIKRTTKSSIRENVSFDKSFSHIISHELLHHIIETEIDSDASDKLDNLPCNSLKRMFLFGCGI